MSASIHVTKRNFKGLSKKEIHEQATEPHSDLQQWAKKKEIKKHIKEKRKSSKSK